MIPCPSCRLFMEPLPISESEAHVCPVCGGLWVALPASAEAARTAAMAWLSERTLPETFSSELPLWCPKCAGSLLETSSEGPLVAKCSRCDGQFLKRDVWSSTAPIASPIPSSSIEVGDAAPRGYGAPAAQEEQLEPTDPMERLLAGNRRFSAGVGLLSHVSSATIRQASEHPTPFALVVACSDCRMPPEFVFDQPYGSLMTVRAPGLALSPLLIEGIAFAVARYSLPLVAVAGHTSCGAIQAAVEGNLEASYPELGAVLDPIAAKAAKRPGNLPSEALEESIVEACRWLRAHPELSRRVESGDLVIAGMKVDLRSGTANSIEWARFEQPVEAVPIPPNEPPPVAEEDEEPLPDASFILDPATISSARWCPQCRQRLVDLAESCESCNSPSVTGDYPASCLACKVINPISSATCKACRSELHPQWLERTPRPKKFLANLFGRGGD